MKITKSGQVMLSAKELKDVLDVESIVFGKYVVFITPKEGDKRWKNGND